MTKSNFEGWDKVIKDIPMSKREPMWDQAIKYLVAEDALGATMQYELSQEAIQTIILGNHYGDSIQELFQEFGRWLVSAWGSTRFYVCRFNDGNELWLAYLMAVYHAMEWDGENWVSIGKEGD